MINGRLSLRRHLNCICSDSKRSPPEPPLNDETNQFYYSQENQRPPVYNPEDYVQSLKKYGRRPSGTVAKSIYDTADDVPEEQRSATLPGKLSAESKSQMTEMNEEMSLRQFGSVTDLLTKLRADLRASFPR